tara:strand:- start:60 stop:374 length:315 start_codon:yes stop_codon:yes gene_type:complete
MENSDIFDAHREAQDYSTIWDMDQFTNLDAEVVTHPRPVILYPYYSSHFEQVIRVRSYCKSNSLRDVWAAIEHAHIKTGDWHQFIETIEPHDEAQGIYRVFVGS